MYIVQHNNTVCGGKFTHTMQKLYSALENQREQSHLCNKTVNSLQPEIMAAWNLVNSSPAQIDKKRCVNLAVFNHHEGLSPGRGRLV